MIKRFILSFGAALMLALPALLVAPAPAHAQLAAEACRGAGGNWDGSKCIQTEGRDLEVSLKDIVNLLLFIIGAVAVLMIVIGGLRYVVSGGDSNAVNGAKNTIMYAVIGLAVAALAYAIVNFVIDRIITPPTP